MKKIKMNKEKGFTLIETLIVILILGVLVTILLPMFSNLIIYGKEKAVKTTAHNIKLALQAFYTKYGYFPKAETGLTVNKPIYWLIDTDLGGGGGLSEFTPMPKNPFTGTSYTSGYTDAGAIFYSEITADDGQSYKITVNNADSQVIMTLYE